jgi:uncharacterized protein
MQIVIAGGAGYIGRLLAAYFGKEGHRVTVLSRQSQTIPQATVRDWRDLPATLDNTDVLINLAGKSVNCRYTPANKAAIYDSRLSTTKALAEAILATPHPPSVWLNASSATIYRHAQDRPMDEYTGEIGTGFSVDVCQQWESAFFTPELPHTRRVALRMAMIMGRGNDGVFSRFHTLARLGLGGAMGSGNQYISWMHYHDLCRAISFILATPTLEGPINLAAPNPLPNHIFLRILRQSCHVPIGIPSTEWMLKIGAFVLQTETELLLKSRYVVPKRLLDAGFTFQYPDWQVASHDLV